ncbi:Uncharacterised protein [Enterobacter cloacae]|nr:Uncharacterised protein [Enterobacter cloacae]
MVERPKQATFAVHFQIARGPDGGRSYVAGEDGIVVGEVADLLRQILRVDRFFARFGEIVQPLARIAIIAQGFIEEFAVRFFFQQRQQGGEGGFDIADKRHIHLAVRADAAGINVDLDNFGIRRVERAVRELGAEQDQRVGVHHGVEAAGKTDQPGHADIVRVIVFNVLFPAQGVHNWRLQLTGKFHQLFMRAGAAAAAHQGDIAGVSQQLCQLFQLFFGRGNGWLGRRVPVGGGGFRCGLQRHVPRQHNHRNPAIQDRLTHGYRQHLWDLLRR